MLKPENILITQSSLGERFKTFGSQRTPGNLFGNSTQIRYEFRKLVARATIIEQKNILS